MSPIKTIISSKKSWIAAGLSIIFPGAGHLYVGQTKKAIALFIIDTGILLTVTLSDSLLMRIIMVIIYLAVMAPSVVETYFMSQGKDMKQFQNSKIYISFLLFTTGFSALPLLWQGSAFSKQGKIAWTVAVPVLAAFFFLGLFLFGAGIEAWITETF